MKLLSSATFRKTMENGGKEYVKRGNYKKARKDFDSLKPTEVGKFNFVSRLSILLNSHDSISQSQRSFQTTDISKLIF